MKLRHSLLALALMSALPFFVGASVQTDADMAKARADLKLARDEMRDVSKRIAELSAKLGEGGPQAFAFRYLNEPKRAMVGIVMVPDAKGVRIGAVTPGGPAAKAGMRAGDVLTAVNGKALAARDSKDSDAPVDSARSLLGDLEKGQSVKLSVLRDGKTQQFDLKAERRESWDWAGMLGSIPDLGNTLAPLAKIHEIGDGEEIEIIINGERRMHPAPHHGKNAHIFEFKRDDGTHGERVERIVRQFRDGAPWASLNLSTLNPELGRYFGTEHGVLVLDTSANTLKELKPGDVIQVVDGQPADSVSGVMRALSRKEPGQTLNVEVWRDRKRQVFAVTAPERDQFMFSIPAPPAPPTPPTPNSLPAPPAPPSPHSIPAPPAPPTPPNSHSRMEPPAAPAAPAPPSDELIGFAA
ncbi:MAG: PDZ domain-containing protein [Pseudomonadota bacterium]|nr:PDZ domain-containing protein [Pseudomonadota bacterium]